MFYMFSAVDASLVSTKSQDFGFLPSVGSFYIYKKAKREIIVSMRFIGEAAIPNKKDFELMGIPAFERDVLSVDELGDYTHIVAEKRRQLLETGDEDVFAANGLMRTLANLRQPTAYEGRVIPFMNAWQQMGEEPPIYPA